MDIMVERAAIVPTYRLGSASSRGRSNDQIIQEIGIGNQNINVMPSAPEVLHNRRWQCVRRIFSSRDFRSRAPTTDDVLLGQIMVAKEMHEWMELRLKENKIKEMKNNKENNEKNVYRNGKLKVQRERTLNIENKNA